MSHFSFPLQEEALCEENNMLLRGGVASDAFREVFGSEKICVKYSSSPSCVFTWIYQANKSRVLTPFIVIFRFA